MRHLYLLCIFLGSLLLLSLSFTTSYAQGCNGADGTGIFGVGGTPGVQVGNVCANIDALGGVGTGAIIEVSIGNIFAGDVVEYNTDWGDGTNTGWINLPNVGGTLHRANTAPHYFPSTNTNCEYTATTQIRINGTVCLTSWGTPPTFVRRNREGQANSASSTLNVVSATINGVAVPVASQTTVVEVCAGVATTVTFQDLSKYNCSVAADVPASGSRNNTRRWRQFVYGGAGALNGITGGVTVGATLVPKNSGLNTLVTDYSSVVTYPMTSGGPASGVTDGSDQPSNSGAFGNPPIAITTDAITIPATAIAGEEFVITTRFWNSCNRYDQAATAGSPVEYNATRIRVVAQPTPPTATNQNVCEGSTYNAFSVTGVPANAIVTFYRNNNGVPSTTVLGTDNTSPYQLPTNNYATGAGDSLQIGTPGYYKVWASYTPNVAGALNCETIKVPVTIIIRDRPNTPPEITGSTDVCADGSTVYSFALTGTPDSPTITPSSPPTPASQLNTVGGATQYNWSFDDGSNIDITPPPAGVGPSGTTNKNFGAVFNTAIFGAGTTVARQLRVNSNYTSGTTCASPNETDNLTVYKQSNAGAISQSPAGDICAGSTKDFEVTGFTGAVVQWDVSFNGAAFVPAGLGTSSNPAAFTINIPGTYEYRVTIQNGPCAIAQTSVTFDVDPVPPKPTITSTPDPAVACFGSNVTLTSSNVGGIGTVYRWFKLPDVVTPVQSGASNQLILSTVVSSGDYVVVVRGPGPTNCDSPVSDQVTVTINPLPTVVSVTGGGAVCGGNPAPDIVFTFTGAGPPYDFDFTINVNPGADIVVNNHNALTYTITAPNPGVNTDYSILSLSDANGCAATVLGGTRSVTIGGTAPVLDAPPSLNISQSCDEGGSTTNPELVFGLTAISSASTVGFTLNYTVDGSTNRTKTFDTNANGDPTVPITFSDAELNNLAPSPHVIHISTIISPTFCQLVVDANLNFTVNPLPSAPVSAGNVIACSDVVATTAIAVTNPGAGFTTDWYAAASGGGALLSGNISFTPGAAGTYHAEMRNTTTGCTSTSRTGVTLTSDALPPVATAGPLATPTCDDVAVLVANNDGVGLGSWSVTNSIYNQTFSTYENNQGLNGATPGSPTTFMSTSGDWSITVPGSPSGIYTASDPNDWFKVDNGAFSARDVNNQVTWETRNINVSAFTNVKISIDLRETGAQTGTELIRATYSIDGGAEQLIGEIVDDATPVDDAVKSFTVTTASTGTNLKVFVRVLNTADGDRHTFDNLQVFATAVTGLAKVTDINLENSAVTNLQVGNNEFTWTIRSALGACTPTTSSATILRHPQPVTFDITRAICEDVFSTLTNTDVNLTAYENDITSVAAANRIVTWNTNPNLGAGTQLTAADALSYSVDDTDPLYVKVEDTSTGCDNTSPNLDAASITFTVNGKPSVVNLDGTPGPDKGQIQFCEDDITSPGLANDVDLTVFNAEVRAIAGMSFSWHTTLADADPSPGSEIPVAGVNAITANNFDVSDGLDLFVRVANSTTGCLNVATTEVLVRALPALRNIIGLAQPCELTEGFYFLNGGISAISDYSWSIPAAFDPQIGGGSTDFGVFLSFPTVVDPAQNLVVNEIYKYSTGYTTIPSLYSASGILRCTGDANILPIKVVDSPPAITVQALTGDAILCEGETDIFEAVPDNAPLSNYTWEVDPPASATLVAIPGTNRVQVTAGTVNFLLEATEVGASCIGDRNDLPITVNLRPDLVDDDETDCSNLISDITFTNTGAIGTTPATDYRITAVTPSASGLVADPANFDVSILPVLTAGDNLAIQNDRFKNSTGGPINVTYTVVSIANGCDGPTEQLTFTVNPEPVLSSTLDRSDCSDLSGTAAGITLAVQAGSTPATSFRVTGFSQDTDLTEKASNIIKNSTVLPITLTGVNDLANERFTNTSGDIQSIVYTISGVSSNNCLGTPATLVTLNIKPEPVVTAVTNKEACSGTNLGAVTFSSNLADVTGQTFNWTNSNIAIGLGNSGSGNISAFTVSDNLTSIDAFGNVIVSATKQGCTTTTANQKTFEIRVNPEPVTSTTLDNAPCSGEATGLLLNTNGTSIGALSWNVSQVSQSVQLTGSQTNGLGLANSALSGDIFTNATNGNLTTIYQVTPIGDPLNGPGGTVACIGDARNITMTIKPEPVTNPSLIADACSDADIDLLLTVQAGSIAAETWDISILPGNLDPDLVIGQSTTGTGIPTVNLPTTLADDDYNNTESTTLEVIYTVTPRSSLGNGQCYGEPFDVTVTIKPEPVTDPALYALPSPFDPCSDTQTTVMLATDGNSIGATSWNVTLNSKDGLLTGTPTVGNGLAAGALAADVFTNITPLVRDVVYNVTPVNNGFGEICVGDTELITVNVKPEPKMSATLDKAVCSPLNIALVLDDDASAIGANSYTVVSRNEDAGIVVVTGAAIGVASEKVSDLYLFNDEFSNTTNGNSSLDVTYRIKPISSPVNGECEGNELDVVITIDPEPVVEDLDNFICSDVAIGLVLDTEGTSVPAISYNIDGRNIGTLVPNGSLATITTNVTDTHLQNDTYTNTSNGNLNVTYDVSAIGSVNNCVSSVPKTITYTIRPEPIATTNMDLTQCSDVAIGLNLSRSGTATADIDPILWNIITITPSPDLTANAANVTTSNGVAATYLQSDQFTNNTNNNLSKTVQYDVRPVSAFNCVGNSEVVTVTIDPEPVLSTGLNREVCSDSDINLALSTSNATATSYSLNDVRFPPTTGFSATTVTADPVTGLTANALLLNEFHNESAGTVLVEYDIVPVRNLCNGNLVTVVASIHPEPVGADDLTTVIVCSNEAIAYDLQTANINTLGNGLVNTQFQYSDPVAAPAGVVSVLGKGRSLSLGPIADTYSNLSIPGTDVLVTYTVFPFNVTGTSAGNCAGTDFDIVARVHPQPVAPPVTIQNICSDDRVGGAMLAYDLQTIISGPGGNGVDSKFTYTVFSNDQPNVNAGADRTLPATDAAINDIYENKTSNIVTVTYTVIPYRDGVKACEGEDFELQVNVRPEPVGSDFLETICADGAVLNRDIQDVINRASPLGNSLPSIFSYTVDSDNGTVPPFATEFDRLPINASDDNITDSYTNTTSGIVTITYTITPYNQLFPTCDGDAFDYVFEFKPTPVGAPLTIVPPVCSDVAIPVTSPQVGITNSVTLTDYTWDLSYDGVPTLTNQTGDLLGTFTNNTSTAGKNAVFTITPIATGCTGLDYTITFNINPEPVLADNLDVEICSDGIYGRLLEVKPIAEPAATFNVTAVKEESFGVPTTFLTGVPTTGPALVANDLFNNTFTNLTTSQLRVRYTVIPKGNNTCIGDSKDVVLRVNPEPVLFVPTPADVCSDNTDNPSRTDIILGTNGTSVGAASYTLQDLLYSIEGTGIFTAAPPTGLVLGASPNNKTIGSSGLIDLIRADRFTNTSVTPMIVRYTIQPVGPVTGIGSCLGDEQDIDITINPQPDLEDALNPFPACSGVALGLSAELRVETSPASVAATTYNILSVNSGTMTVGGTNSGIGNGKLANAIENDFYINTTPNTIQAIYSVAPVSAVGCIGPDQTVSVDINPAPDLDNGLNKITCNDDVSGIVLATTFDTQGPTFGVQAATYEYTGIVIGTDLTRTAGATPAFPQTITATDLNADQFANASLATRTVIYSVRPVSIANCKGPIEQIVLTVEPLITMNASSTDVICSGDISNFPLSSSSVPSAGGISFNYTTFNPNSVQGTSGSQNNLTNPYLIADVLTNNNNVPRDVTYRVIPRAESAKAGQGCQGSQVDFTITVQPKPKLTALPANLTICEGVPVNIDFSTVSVPAGAGIGIVQFQLDNVVASTDVTGFNTIWPTDYGVGIDVLNDDYENDSDVPQVVRYNFTPKFSMNADVCTGDATSVIVTVNPRPKIALLTDVEVCSGEEFTQAVSVTEADPASTLVTWTKNPTVGITGSSSGAGENITQVLFNNTDDVGTVTYTFIPKLFNCTGDPVDLVATVLPAPKLIDLESTFNICNDEEFELELATEYSNTSDVSFDWRTENADAPSVFVTGTTTEDILTGVGNGSGTTLADVWTNGADALSTVSYTIIPFVLKSDPTATIPKCTGPEKILSLNVAPIATAALTSSDDLDPNNSYLCEGSKDFVFFTMNGLPSFDVTYTDDGGTTVHTLLKQGGVKLLQVQPTQTTTYTLLSVSDAFGCVTPISGETVTVNVGRTDARFDVVGDAIACSPFPAEFAYNQQSNVTYNWKWFNGDPDSTYTASTNITGKTVKHIFENPAPTATVKFKVYLETSLADPLFANVNGCFKTTTKEVQVYPTVAAQVFTDKTEICSGEEVRFVNTSQGVRSDKYFYRVQGSTGELEPRIGNYTPPQKPATSTLYTLSNLTGSNPIVLEVVYQSANLNCPAPDVVIPITVYRGMTADFTTSTPTQFIGGHSFVDVTNTSNPIEATDFTYEWNFGLDSTPEELNGTTPPNPIDYTTPGSKEISLVLTNILAGANGLVCRDEVRKTIIITVPPLVADFDAIPLAACFPTDITIVENRATGDEFEWEVIDEGGRTSATSNANLPVFAIPNPGKYTVFLTTRNSFTGDAKSTSKELQIFELPTASFEVRPAVVFIPDQEITTFNFSSGANQYEWDFGDGNTSFDFEPTLTYKIEGEYPITLVVGFNNGSHDVDGDGVKDGTIICYDTLTRTVQAKDGGVTRIPNSFTPNPNGPNGGNAGSGSFNDVFLPITKGVEEFMMQVFDRWGNLVFESREKDQGWDGYHRNGSLMPAGVYVYKLELRLSNGQRTTQVGDITLIR